MLKEDKNASHEKVAPDSSAGTDRREFMQQAGKAGIAGGLASFLLVGGVPKGAFAAEDDPACAAPYDSNAGDTCQPITEANPDLCPTTPLDENSNGTVSGDECTPNPGPVDGDTCLARANASLQWLDDTCNPENPYDVDHCPDRDEKYYTGDLMRPGS